MEGSEALGTRFMRFRVHSSQTMREGLVSAELIPDPDSLPVWRSWDILYLYVDVKGRRREVLIDNRVKVEKPKSWFSFNLMKNKSD